MTAEHGKGGLNVAVEVQADEFRRTMATFATGVTVVTVDHEGGVHGMTANAFTSVSLNPPLILVSVDKKTHTHDMIAKAETFGVSILRRDQEALSRHYGGKPDPALQPQHEWVKGVPVLRTCLSSVACRVWASYEGGDHTLFVGRVLDMRLHGGDPLIFFDRAYRQLQPNL